MAARDTRPPGILNLRYPICGAKPDFCLYGNGDRPYPWYGVRILQEQPAPVRRPVALARPQISTRGVC